MSIVQQLYDQILDVVLEEDERPIMPNRQARRAALRYLLENEDENQADSDAEFIPVLPDSPIQ